MVNTRDVLFGMGVGAVVTAVGAGIGFFRSQPAPAKEAPTKDDESTPEASGGFVSTNQYNAAQKERELSAEEQFEALDFAEKRFVSAKIIEKADQKEPEGSKRNRRNKGVANGAIDRNEFIRDATIEILPGAAAMVDQPGLSASERKLAAADLKRDLELANRTSKGTSSSRSSESSRQNDHSSAGMGVWLASLFGVETSSDRDKYSSGNDDSSAVSGSGYSLGHSGSTSYSDHSSSYSLSYDSSSYSSFDSGSSF